jgi:purine nucleoside permease
VFPTSGTSTSASWVARYARDSDKIWSQLIDFKYSIDKPNILTCGDVGASNFWKGVVWAARVARMSYRWKIGNGKK